MASNHESYRGIQRKPFFGAGSQQSPSNQNRSYNGTPPQNWQRQLYANSPYPQGRQYQNSQTPMQHNYPANQMPMQARQQSPIQGNPQARQQSPIQGNPQARQQSPIQSNPQARQPAQMPNHPMQQHSQAPPMNNNQQQQGSHMPTHPSPQPSGQLPVGDGIVRFEPVDENLFKQFKGGNPSVAPSQNTPPHAPQNIPQNAPPNVPQHTPPSTNDVNEIPLARTNTILSDKIGQFVQNERNAGIYYKNLSERSTNQFYKSILDQITQTSTHHMELYNTLYNQHKGSNFEPKEEAINTDVEFHEGIRLAILEENKLFKDLTDMYDNAHDPNDVKVLNSLMHKKSNLLNHLHLINQNFF